jgi:hypothetical protein
MARTQRQQQHQQQQRQQQQRQRQPRRQQQQQLQTEEWGCGRISEPGAQTVLVSSSSSMLNCVICPTCGREAL